MSTFTKRHKRVDKSMALSWATMVLDLVAIGLSTTILISNAVPTSASAEPAMISTDKDLAVLVEPEVEETTYSGTLSISDEDEPLLSMYREEMLEESLALPYHEEDTTDDSPLERDFITMHSDLHVDKCPDAATLDKILEWWNPRIGSGEGTRFLGHGDAFYEAWEKTGIDPLILMGIAAWEGGWGNSRVALAKNNFYGIGVYDSDPLYWASTLGTNVHDGIVNGAVWIYEHYYLDGNTTLALINNNGYNGYNGGTYWAETITDQMINVHYRVCKEILSEEGGDNND